MASPVFAPYKLFALVQGAKEFGLTATEVLKGTDLREDMLDDGKVHSSVRQYLIACENVIRRCDDLLLPLRVGKSIHLSAYGLYGFALLSSATVRAGFDFAVRYHLLATPMFSIAWHIDAGHFVWTFPDEGRLGYSLPVRRFLLAQQLGQHVTHVHDIAHVEREPIWIDVAFEKPVRPEIFEQELGCEVRFGKSSTAIVYDMSILDDRPPMTNPVTHAMLRETCEGLIGAVEYGGGVAGQVARLIMESPAPVTTMEWVADRLAITSRTLRRRLAEQGTTFSAISDQVRSELAKKYLEAGGFSVADIGDLLGFSDTKNFRMFFRRWNNISPKGYRERISMHKDSARENPTKPFPQITL